MLPSLLLLLLLAIRCISAPSAYAWPAEPAMGAALAMLPASRRPLPPIAAPGRHIPQNRILFAAQYYRKSGWYFQQPDASRSGEVHVHQGKPEDEMLTRDGAAGVFLLNPAPPNHVRRLTPRSLNSSAPAWAPDGSRVVFEGYPHRMQREDESNTATIHHLYSVNIDGSGVRRLTFGRSDDTGAMWSPDGRWIAFMRAPASYDAHNEQWKLDGTMSLCLLDPTTRVIHPLLSDLSGAPDSPIHYNWSPDGQWVTTVIEDSSDDDTAVSTLLLLDPSGVRPQRRIANCVDWDWSPDGRRLFVKGGEGSDSQHGEERDRILDIRTGAVTNVFRPLNNVRWLDNTHLIGDFENDGEYNRTAVCLIGADGQLQPEQGAIDALPVFAFSDGGAPVDINRCRNWLRIPGPPDQFLVTYTEYKTDGGHPSYFWIDLRQRRCRLTHTGRAFCLSPDGSYFATADYQWVGPYKRGGQRVGPLEIVSLKDGKARAVTPRLADISFAEWR